MEKFLNKNKVKSIINSHNTYLIGLLPRIGISMKIPVYKVGPANAYKTDKKIYILLMIEKIPKNILSYCQKNKKKVFKFIRKKSSYSIYWQETK